MVYIFKIPKVMRRRGAGGGGGVVLQSYDYTS